MDSKTAKRLKIGDRVIIWQTIPDACTGSVIETGYNAAKIEWDDGQIGIIHLNDFGNIERYRGEDKIIPDPKAA